MRLQNTFFAFFLQNFVRQVNEQEVCGRSVGYQVFYVQERHKHPENFLSRVRYDAEHFEEKSSSFKMISHFGSVQ